MSMMKVLAVAAILFVAQGQAANVRYGRDMSQYKPGWMRYPEIQKIMDDAIANNPDLDGKIVGGMEAKPHSFPHQVGLFIDNEYFCGGSIISEEWVLTAGHCTEMAKNIVVVAGAHKIQQDESTQVKRMASKEKGEIMTHPKFNLQKIENDLGLVKMSEKLKFNDNIKSVMLGNMTLPTGTMVTPTGWGKDSDQAPGISSALREVTVPTITKDKCKMTYGDIIINQVCTDATGGKGTCNGDSGGPLNYKGKTYGITSFGSSMGCQAGLPDAFTNVVEYLDWIKMETNVTP